MKTDFMPAKKLAQAARGDSGEKFNKALVTLFSGHNILLFALSFLIGRGQLAGGLMPFGMAFFSAAYGLEINKLAVSLFILFGMVTGGAKGQLSVTAASILLFCAVNLPFRNNSARQTFRYAITAFSSFLIPGVLLVFLQGFLLYDLLRTLFSSFVVFLLVFIFKNAIAAVSGSRKRYAYSNEEVISIAILIALCVSGLGEIKILGFGLKNVISILLVLIFSYKCGVGAGAAIGVSVGLIVSMSSAMTPLLISTYAFCGLLAGLFRNLGKLGSGLGFVMGNAVLTLYLNGSTEVLIYLKEILLAVAAFLLVPQKVIDMAANVFRANVQSTVDKSGYSARIRELTVQKLNKFSNAFRELSRTFSEISQTRVAAGKDDISSLFDRVADKVCRDCSLCLHCWDRNFYNTYQVMFKIVEKLDVKGRIDEEDIPAYFLERCERINEFVREANNIYEIFKVDMVWKNKIVESRELVSYQLEGLSRVISGLASEIDTDVSFKSELEADILSELNRAGIRTYEVVAYENNHKKYEISIIHKGCGGKRSCIGTIQKLVSAAAGRKMVKADADCSQKGSDRKCTLKLVEEETFSITTGIAKASKSGGMVSGDSYTFMNTGCGKFIAALSDGMGTGQKASAQSKTTISLLEQFMDSGFDKDTTVKLINSILVLKSSDDTFSTIDLALVDLYTGETEFVKVGAIPTYIKRGDRMESIKSASLPAGIFNNIELELARKKLDNGNLIIMMTDGVLDSFKKREEESDKSLEKYLEGLSSLNPQQVAEDILEEAYRNCSGNPADDMTVLVAKVWKRAG